jgi:2-polyprenyl-3-methyl-5-hydroxy-6-metoxy-1,4-benzoquinol methylase
VEKLPFKAQVFDCVVCTEVLEHVDSPERLSAELVRVTRTAGRLCLTVPNELITTLGRFLLRKSPYKSPAHKTVFSWARLRRLFPLILLRRTHVPFGFLPFLISTNLVALFGKPGDGRA